ncbi:hypothetical protein M8C21_003712 [Ambrosia artemisiifolia]|uniref:Uncharacterized protein n=1 Tax=Ambrosia artemisiifolia TaxID=4212 RepID=A0AAD5BW06_AMBAR|nr:hypothetical protein M8C21_003712 [Ambrosia artemisiifolia]
MVKVVRQSIVERPLFKELKDEEVEFFRAKFAGGQADRADRAVKAIFRYVLVYAPPSPSINTLDRRIWTPAYLLFQENSFIAQTVPPMETATCRLQLLTVDSFSFKSAVLLEINNARSCF